MGLGFSRIPYSSLKSKVGVWAWMVGNIQLFKEADVIHVHDVYWWYFPLRFLLLRKASFITFHGYEGSGLPTLKAKIIRKVSEILADGSICVGAFMRKWYWAKPDQVIFGAADFTPTPLPHFKSMVFIGRLDYDTGIMTYLEMLRYLPKEFTLDVYGDGPLLSKVQAIIKKQRLPVGLHEWTDEVEQVLKSSRYALVSRYLGIIEAMQVGRLVVAAYNNEIKKDYLLTHPQKTNMIIGREAKALAVQLLSLSTSQEKNMIEPAQDWAKTQTWEKIARGYIHLWRNKK
jgi:glycosyltransferase involved in cell wall biosynthesis